MRPPAIESQGRRQPSTLCSASGDSTDNGSDFDVDDRRPRLGVRLAIAERASTLCSASGNSTDNGSDFDVDDRRPRLGVRSVIADRGSAIDCRERVGDCRERRFDVWLCFSSPSSCFFFFVFLLLTPPP
ncbi:Hypothetical predicted protein [Olea europaea subsp. europaea]|uniref:Uncharacterized protein n=1 Tax=Olea europaea subsp. europaea TaxID=158383 RepID=A0A8S0QFD7_OLEEU|nr:Hypothetical predicted protein [Olea europaea subsp. europaea]